MSLCLKLCVQISVSLNVIATADQGLAGGRVAINVRREPGVRAKDALIGDENAAGRS